MQYLKIKQAIIEQIESGMLSPLQKLPAERQLAEAFHTTRVTLREALSLLEMEGEIFREERRGWFISPAPLIYDLQTTDSIVQRASLQQRIVSTRLDSAQTLLIHKQASAILNLAPFSHIHQLVRTHYLDDRPVMYAQHYIRADNFKHLLEHDLTGDLNRIYTQYYNTPRQKVRYRIATGSITEQAVQALRATSSSPIIRIERTYYDQNSDVIDCEIEFWRHDAIRLESSFDLDII